MASGKQLSFQYGEVSPSLRYRSDAVSYAAGLGKLRNMYVRRAGGVSNRPGLEFIKLALTQDEIPEPGGPMGVKAHTFWSAEQNKWGTAEYYRTLSDGYKFYIDGTVQYTYETEKILGPSPQEVRFTNLKSTIFVSPNLSLETTNLSPSPEKQRPLNVALIPDFLNVMDDRVGDKTFSGNFTVEGTSTGQTPILPVSYLFTATLGDGSEVKLFGACSVGFIPGTYPGAMSGLAMPHASMTSTISLIAFSASSDVKIINMYRASGAKAGATSVTAITYGDATPDMFYKLAGRQVYTPFELLMLGTTTSASAVITAIADTSKILVGMVVNVTGFAANRTVVSKTANSITLNTTATSTGTLRWATITKTIYFTDYGADDAAVTPPIDHTFLGETTSSIRGTSHDLYGVQAAAFYQQRMVMAMKPGTTDFKAGEIMVSKIGAPDQIKTPLIFSDTAAFRFSIPVTDGTPCVALLAMERLMAFTEAGTYVVKGGEQGILTPTMVNPLLVSGEGCSTTVEPKMTGRRGYFVNNDHTKLMEIIFGVDGNLEVKEASVFSDHFLREDVVQLEVLGGAENTVYLLLRNGTLVRITASEEAHGFALMETSGYIESIYRGKAKRPYAPNANDLPNSEKYYDVLMCYVIRNGSRTLERLNIRDDRHREGEFFADCYDAWGWRLSDAGILGYSKNPIKAMAYYNMNLYLMRINIEASPLWTAGENIKIRSTASLVPLGYAFGGYVIHFFYDDANGKNQTLRYVIDLTSHAVVVDAADPEFTFAYNGYFTSEVPEALRDANGQAENGTITVLTKNKLLTRWLPAINKMQAGSQLVGAYLSAPNSGGGLALNYSAPVVVVADGEILSSPNNPNKPTLYMAYDEQEEDIILTLPDYYSYGYVGIPYTSEFETLDLETQGERTLTDAHKIINSVGVGFMETRGGFYGMPDQALSDMEELISREDESFNTQTANVNEHLEINVPAAWNKRGRVNIKQVDPAPITILSVYPKGISGD